VRNLSSIIIHCAYTRPSMDIGVKEIDSWHRGRGWDSVGYHRVIRRNGAIEKGRPIHVVGAHALGHNHDSIGVCLIGGMKEKEKKPDCNFTKWQWHALEVLIETLQAKYGPLDVFGHRDVSSKECPCFDVRQWWSKR